MGSKVQITIQGRSFTIKAVDDGHKLRQIASELGERLNAQTSRARHFDDYSVAIITALNINQAKNRSAINNRNKPNKGSEAANAVIMILKNEPKKI